MSHVKALILACVDDRLQNDLVRFADERGWSEQFCLMAVPGDCFDIARSRQSARTDLARLKFLIEAKQPEHLVIIAHQDCAARKATSLIESTTPVTVQMEMCAVELRTAVNSILHESRSLSRRNSNCTLRSKSAITRTISILSRSK